jgi:hypothetical protein
VLNGAQLSTLKSEVCFEDTRLLEQFTFSDNGQDFRFTKPAIAKEMAAIAKF